MEIVARILVGFVAFIHIYILWLEMFAWTTRARKVFRGFPQDLFEKTKPMAANQGLYNGFLAAGLIWSLIIENEAWSINIATFFLLCVLVAGAYGAATVQKKIFLVQGVPAILGLAAVLLNV